MVNESPKEGEQETRTEEAVRSSGSPEPDASEETALHSQVNSTADDKSHGDTEEAGQETTGDEEHEEPAKRSRGRPKKSDSSEPPAKKAKKKERPSPARTSARVKNQRAGVKLENTEELPERKRSPTKKVAKNGVEQNGATVEV